MEFKSLPQLLDYFKDERTCIAYYERLRWNGTPACPHCGRLRPYRLKEGFKCSDSGCRKKFTVRVGSIFQGSKLPFRIWFAAMYLYVSRKKGISSVQLALDLNVTQKTAWFMLHRIRKMFEEQKAEKFSGDKIVEADETYIGGKEKNRHMTKKLASPQTKLANDGTRYNEKQVVVGAIERSGRVVIKHVPDASKKSIQGFLKTYVPKKSVLISDEHRGYDKLEKTYFHYRVNHSSGTYVEGNSHTNTIESFWCVLKKGLYGVYHSVSPKHLSRYLDEYASRFNNRNLVPYENFNNLLSNSEGNLLYRDLIGQ